MPHLDHLDPLCTTWNLKKRRRPVKEPDRGQNAVRKFTHQTFTVVVRIGSDRVAAVAKPESPLDVARRLFGAGDMVAARRELAAQAEDAARPDADRQLARELSDATRIDRGALAVGAACVGLLVLVVLVTILKQP